MSLKKKTFTAVRWTTVSAFFRIFIQFLQVAVLARLLSPADYGLMAIITIMLGFSGLFSDLGVGSAFVQEQVVDNKERSSLFWFNVSVGAVIMIILMMLSPLIAWFFNEPKLLPLVLLSSTVILIGAIGLQIRMAAEKELEFRSLSLIESLAAILTFITAASAAYSGLGVYSLVIGAIAGASCTTILNWIFNSKGWRPLWHFNIVEVNRYLNFGGTLTVNHIVNYFNSSLDLFMAGRLLGAEILGLYSLPRDLSLRVQGIFNPIITRISFPLIAKVQHESSMVREIYLKTINMTSSVNAPIYLSLTIFAHEIILVWLGPKWTDAAHLLIILSIWGGIRSTANPVGSLLFGMGRADLSLKWNLGVTCITPIFLYLGIQNGVTGLAFSMLFLMSLLIVPGWFILVNPLCKIELFEFLLVTFKPFVLAIISIFPAFLLVQGMQSPIARVISAAFISVPLYWFSSLFFNREWTKAVLELVWRKEPI